MKQIMNKTTTYRVDEHYLVDIVEFPDNLKEAWLYHDSYGTKTFMFGTCMETLSSFLEIVERNLPDYIKTYNQEYVDIIDV